ncbi:MAG: TldD/PmbA family protein [Chloroflexi bacterium]|nr:TldD/PmbA family protein [Chloroflexota bacterium]
MLNHANLRDELTLALRGHDVEYCEVRLEENASARIAYRARDLEDIGRTTNLGGGARAYHRGGWGFVSFNDLSGLRNKVAEAAAQARLAGKGEGALARVEPVVDIVPPTLLRDPRTVPLADKKRILDEYNEIIWRTERISSSVIGYGDAWKRVVFANSDGAYIDQSRQDVTLRVMAVARKDGDVQQAGFSIGRLGDYSFIEQQHDAVREAARRAVEFLDAPAVKGGEYPVVLDPVLAGVFCHEAFGHISESDFVYENPPMRELMVLGKRFGQPILNIVDGGALPDLRGTMKYDDEGTPTTRTDLIREGVLVGRLHSRQTAAKTGEQPTGIIEPGKATFDELIADIKEGVYARNWYGGMTSMEMFTFSAGEAYMIRNGKVAELVRPVVLSGNVFETLQRLDGVGDDLDVNQGGGCGKGGQSPLPVSNGSPHIRIRQCLVGGR